MLVKYMLGEASPEEIGTVEQWLEADPGNRRHYEHFLLIWQESRLPGSQFTFDEQAAWKKFQQRIGDERPVRHSVLFRSSWIWAAASLLLLVVMAVSGYLLFRPSPAAIATRTLRSPSGAMTDTLPDGSIVVLNRYSTISYPEKFQDSSGRTVQLRGEAFFSVAPDKNRPFRVHTGEITVTALGTSFNVRTNGQNTEVIVETGLVKVVDPHHSLLVAPNEKLILHKNDTSYIRESVAGDLYKYYRTKSFVCDNTPLWQLIDDLNETYNIHISIKRPSLRELRLNATFRDESPEQILSVVCKTFRITMTRTGGQIDLQ
jgi:transmembrane sensor